MEIIGIICEYNPFHNGHIYHLNKIKELYPNSLIILVMSGYFLERGEISLLTKEEKVKIALENNIDLVIDLPTVLAVQSADIFAKNALYILNKLKVNRLIFGSESNDLNWLEKIVDIELNDLDYNNRIKSYLDKGYNYPTSMAKALNSEVITTPNDLLGISYIKEIKKNNYQINYETIKRTSNYHDKKSNNKIISASNIRHKLANQENIKLYLPKESFNNLVTINNTQFFNLLKYNILTNSHLQDILTVDEGIHHKLKKSIKKAQNLEELTTLIKSKRYTYNRLNRMYIHILLNIKKNTTYTIDYIKILGFNNRGQAYLNKIKKELDIYLNPNFNSLIYQIELNASLIYDMLTNQNTYLFESQNKPIIFDK